MAITLSTPKNVTIIPRQPNLTFDGLPRTFIKDNPVLTALFCSLSAVFPPGERQFINSVRYYQDHVTDPEMKKRIRAFIGQEAHHGNQHDVFNEKIQALGWRVDLIERQTTFFNTFIKRFSPQRQLAQTVALEHLTALFADFLMHNPNFLGDKPNQELKTLFLWHAIEETEHKAVAYDLYQQVVGDDKLRTREMKVMLPFFMGHMIESTWLLLYKNKELSDRSGWKEAWQQLIGKDGIFAGVKDELQDYFSADFHPWQQDNSKLANEWLGKLAL